jgi:hypothetical protein
MKFSIFYFIFIFISFNVLGQASSVILSSEKGERFTVFLNGEKQNKVPASKVEMKEIEAPFYKIKILFATGKIKPLQKTLMLEPGFQATYIIKKAGKNYKVVLSNSIPLARKILYAEKSDKADTISGKGSVQVDPSPKVKTAFIPGYMGQIGCPRPINAMEFSVLRKNILSKNLEEDKQKAAKQALTMNCLLVSQIKEMLMLFSFEKTRIDYAKLAYAHTYDIGNYAKVAEAFLFESSANELSTFLKDMPRH